MQHQDQVFTAISRPTALNTTDARTSDRSSAPGDIALDIGQGIVHVAQAFSIAYLTYVAAPGMATLAPASAGAAATALVVSEALVINELHAAGIDFSAAWMRASGSDAKSVEAYEKANEIGLVRAVTDSLTDSSAFGKALEPAITSIKQGATQLQFVLGLVPSILKEFENERAADRKQQEEGLKKDSTASDQQQQLNRPAIEREKSSL